jgi:hypothetical protein
MNGNQVVLGKRNADERHVVLLRPLEVEEPDGFDSSVVVRYPPIRRTNMTSSSRIKAIVFLTLLCPLFLSQAEEPLRIGIGVGMNIGKLALPADTWPDDSELYQSPHKGMIIAAFVQARISNLAYFVPQIRYIQRGTRVENVSFYDYANGQYLYVPRGSIQLDAEFIEFSTIFMTKFGWGAVSLCPNFGPVIGIRLSSESKYEYVTAASPHPRVTVNKDVFFPPIALGFELGMSLEIFPTGQLSYLVSCGYNIGLTDFGLVYGLPAGNSPSRDVQVSLATSFAL